VAVQQSLDRSEQRHEESGSMGPAECGKSGGEAGRKNQRAAPAAVGLYGRPHPVGRHLQRSDLAREPVEPPGELGLP
jgi:hypothetical protein